MDAGTFRVFHEIGLLIILKSFSSVQYNCECPGVLHMHNEQHILLHCWSNKWFDTTWCCEVIVISTDSVPPGCYDLCGELSGMLYYVDLKSATVTGSFRSARPLFWVRDRGRAQVPDDNWGAFLSNTLSSCSRILLAFLLYLEKPLKWHQSAPSARQLARFTIYIYYRVFDVWSLSHPSPAISVWQSELAWRWTVPLLFCSLSPHCPS